MSKTEVVERSICLYCASDINSYESKTGKIKTYCGTTCNNKHYVFTEIRIPAMLEKFNSISDKKKIILSNQYEYLMFCIEQLEFGYPVKVLSDNMTKVKQCQIYETHVLKYYMSICKDDAVSMLKHTKIDDEYEKPI